MPEIAAQRFHSARRCAYQLAAPCHRSLHDRRRDFDRGAGVGSAGCDLRLPGVPRFGLHQLGISDPNSQARGEPGGGMANAIVGSMLILGIASVIGVPFGIGAGIYLAEFGRNRFGSAIRFTADVLNGVPSIVIGIVAWADPGSRSRVFCAGGRSGAGDHDGPDDHSHHGRDAAAGAAGSARSSLWTGRPALADHSFNYSPHRDLGRDYRSDAGLCPCGGRNRATAFHRSWATRFGICTTTSRRPLCRCRSTSTRIRLMMTGTARHGRDRSCLSFLIVSSVAAVRYAVRRGTFGAA